MGTSILVEALHRPATSLLGVLLVGVWAWLQSRGWGYGEVGMSYERVVAQKQYWRLASAQLSHVDLLHLLFNVSALWSIGLVESAPALGTPYYLQQTALLFLLSPAICMGLYYLLIHVGKREEYRQVTAVGYSCVLFGWMALLAARQPGGITMLPLFGLGSVPLWATPFGSLLLTSLIVPRASFLGHLAGILAGYGLATGLLDWVTPWAAISLLAWAVLGAAYLAHRAQQLQLPLVRLPGALGAPLLGAAPAGGSSADVEAGGGGGTRIVNGEIVRR